MTIYVPPDAEAGGMVSVNDVFDHSIDPAARVGRDRLAVFPTGFSPLDHVLGGGFRTQELVLVGGRPGVGKTIAALQWARMLALQGCSALYVCYEHSAQTLLGRLLALEVGSIARADEVTAVDHLRAQAFDVAGGAGDLAAFVAHPLGEEAVGRLRSYGDRLKLVQASARRTGPDEIEALVQEHRSGPTALFVDYVQKVHTPAPTDDEGTRSGVVVEALKELALRECVVVVAIAASDQGAFEARRMRLHHLRGAAALAHECDVALVLNEKSVAVSKVHLAYDAVRAETFKRKVVFSVEKHRGGATGMDLEFTKDFGSFRFEPDGAFVSETLIDGVLVDE
jgi:predicted ATP-dependent serine protease